MSWNFDGGRPIYAQLVEQLTAKIVSGEYPPGHRIPPVRELAAEAGVNPNTLQRAFGELERQGLLYTERTAGRFVTDDAARVEAVRSQLACRLADDFLQKAALLGYGPAQALELLSQRRDPHE